MTKHIFLASVLAAAACGDSTPNKTQNECGAGTTLQGTECVADVACGAGTTAMAGMCVPNPAPDAVYVQVEHLARPGINEALVLGDANLEGYNATAPSFAGAPPAAVAAITGEAKTVLSALHLGGS